MVNFVSWFLINVLGILLVMLFTYIGAMLLLPVDPSSWSWLALLAGLLAAIVRLGDAFRGG